MNDRVVRYFHPLRKGLVNDEKAYRLKRQKLLQRGLNRSTQNGIPISMDDLNAWVDDTLKNHPKQWDALPEKLRWIHDTELCYALYLRCGERWDIRTMDRSALVRLLEHRDRVAEAVAEERIRYIRRELLNP